MTEGDSEGASVATEVSAGVRSNLIAAAGSGIAGGVVAASLAAWALVSTLPGKVGLTPTGAVVAFDLKSGCPSGWQPYYKGAGRFIVGAAGDIEIDNIPGDFTIDKSDVRISKREFGRPGGSQNHTLKLNETPKHNHDTALGANPPNNLGSKFPLDGTFKQTIYGARDGGSLTAMTSFAGEENPSPISIMPPYVALYFCRKD